MMMIGVWTGRRSKNLRGPGDSGCKEVFTGIYSNFKMNIDFSKSSQQSQSNE